MQHKGITTKRNWFTKKFCGILWPMGKAARQHKREARNLVEFWAPRMWLFLWTLLGLAAAAWWVDAIHQHAAGLAWGQAVFAGLPAMMLVLALGLLPIGLMLPLIFFERALKKIAAAAVAAAQDAADRFQKSVASMTAFARSAACKTDWIQARFLASSPAGLGVNQNLVFLTPRILAQRPQAARACAGVSSI